MTDIKALFPIGKTQWAKWTDAQRVAFNEAREAGVPYNDAIQAANQTQATKKKHKNILDVIEDAVEDVANTAAAVGSVAVSVTPVIAVAQTMRRVTKKKAK